MKHFRIKSCTWNPDQDEKGSAFNAAGITSKSVVWTTQNYSYATSRIITIRMRPLASSS